MNPIHVPKIVLAFPIQKGVHDECFYNSQCHPEIFEPTFALLPERLRVVFECLRVNHKQSEFTVTQWAAQCCISLRQLERVFFLELYSTPKQCLDQIRLGHVLKQKDEYPNMCWKQIFYNTGFKSWCGFNYARDKYSVDLMKNGI